MKNIFKLIVLLCISFSAQCQTKTENYSESGFAADFTTKPVINKNDLDTKLGKVQITSYQIEGEDFVILVSENKYPPEMIEKLGTAGIAGIIVGAKNGAKKNLEAQLGDKYKDTSDEDFLFSEKFTANKATGSVGEVKVSTTCIMRGNQFYILIAMGNTEADGVKTFQKSFSFIDNK